MAALGKSREDACGASAQEALEELGCWSDNDFPVFGGKFLGQLNITCGWTPPPPRARFFLPPISLSASHSPAIPRPEIHNGGLAEEEAFRTARFACIPRAAGIHVSACGVGAFAAVPRKLQLQALNGNINANQPFNLYKRNLGRQNLLTCGWVWTCLCPPL